MPYHVNSYFQAKNSLMTAYYNEIDPYAAQWLRNLIEAGHIARGDVDERSIVDVRADELRGYTQAHFFAGIGGWSIALRLAGWPDDRPVWTGPCQPFSAAGAGKAADDERHLWPAWFSLIAECRPAIVFGEQVEAAIGWGWLDAVYADMEAEGYACGAAVLPACSVGAPHIRNRLWFVADASGERAWRNAGNGASAEVEGDSERFSDGRNCGDPSFSRSAICGMADADGRDAGAEGLQRGGQHGQRPQDGGVGGLVDTISQRRCGGKPRSEDAAHAWKSSQAGRGFWSDAEWIPCTDGKARPVGPGSFPLGHGIRNRPSKLRAYGNAIVPQVAAEFIGAAMRASAFPSQEGNSP